MSHVIIDNLLYASLAAGLTVAAFLLASRAGGRAGACDAKRWQWAAAALIASYMAVFIILPLRSYAAYNMGMVDLGHMDQAIWSVLHGRPLEFTFYESGQRVSRMGIHFEPIYFLIAPLFNVWDNARMLLVLQTVVIASGGIPLFRMARQRLGSGLAGIVLLCAYLLHPALQFANLFDFHGDALAAGLLLWALYALEREHWIRFGAFLLLSLACKEYVSLAVAGLGLALMMSGRRKPGILIAMAGLSWFIAGQFLIIPHYRAQYALELEYTRLFYNGTAAMIGRLLSIQNIGTLALVLLPTALLPLLSGWLLLPLVPILGGLMAGKGTFDLHNHHNAVMIPFLLYAAIAGWERCSRFLGRRAAFPAPRGDIGLAAGVLVASLSCTIFWGGSPLSYRFWKTRDWYWYDQLHQYRVTPHDAITDSLITRIPAGVPVAASAEICPHLTHRRDCYMFPSPWITFVGPAAGRFDAGADPRVALVCFDLLERFPLPNFSRARERQALASLLADSAWSIRDLRDGVLLVDKNGNGLAGDVREHKQPATGQSDRRIGDSLELSRYALKHGPGRLTFEAEWAVTGTIGDLIFIDQLYYGTRSLRAVHWPSYLLRPTAAWKRGYGYTETYQAAGDDLPDSVVLTASTVPESPIVTEENEIMPWSTQRIIARRLVWTKGSVTP